MSRQKPLAVLTEQNRSLNRVRYGLIASVIVLVFGLAALALVVGDKIGDLQDSLVTAGSERAQLRTDLTAQQSALDKANERLVDEGLKPVTPPVPATGPAGANGRPPTAREIRKAVETYCTDNGCRGPAGAGVTRSQVALAVATYCDSRGQCRGPRGDSGDDGATGAQGPPPTDAQVSAAVAAFCADGRCRGAVGPPGPQGPPGPAGASVTGPPGPTCPDGFTARERTIITEAGPEQAVVCVAG